MVDTHFLGAVADEVHLDAACLFVIDGTMLKGPEVKVSAELAIDAGQNVPVEGCGYAARIIVSRLQGGPIFAEVNAHEQAVARSHRLADPAQEASRFQALEVADIRAK